MKITREDKKTTQVIDDCNLYNEIWKVDSKIVVVDFAETGDEYDDLVKACHEYDLYIGEKWFVFPPYYHYTDTISDYLERRIVGVTTSETVQLSKRRLNHLLEVSKLNSCRVLFFGKGISNAFSKLIKHKDFDITLFTQIK